MRRFVAAAVQIASEPNQVRSNAEKAAEWTARAVKESGASLLVLPEAVTTGFTPGMPPEALWDLIDVIPGRTTEVIQRAARNLGAWVVFPTYERGPERGIVYNSAALISPQGEVVGVYRKTHLFPTERRSAGGWSTPGRAAPVFPTPLGVVGLTICYDGDFPELYRVLAIQGAEVVARPSALLRSYEIWEVTNKARAYDNHLYIVACNAVGPDAGGNYYFGHSMIVSPIAQKLAQGRGTEEIIFAELDPDPIKRLTYGATTPMRFDHLQDRNLAAYEGLLRPARSAFEPAERSEYLTDRPS
jgi:predicted amidohydrolase